jgi:hypothetical protein
VDAQGCMPCNALLQEQDHVNIHSDWSEKKSHARVWLSSSC